MDFSTIKIFFTLFGSCFGVAAAYFAFISKAQSTKQKKLLRIWFHNRWKSIESNKWTMMPENILKYLFFNINILIDKFIMNLIFGINLKRYFLVEILVPLFSCIGAIIFKKYFLGGWILLLILPLILSSLLNYKNDFDKSRKTKICIRIVYFLNIFFMAMILYYQSTTIFKLFITLLILGINNLKNMYSKPPFTLWAFLRLVGYVLVIIFWIEIFISMDLYIALILSVIGSIPLAIGISNLLILFIGNSKFIKKISIKSGLYKVVSVNNTNSIEKFAFKPIFLFGLTIANSFFITLLFMLIGHLISPNNYLPQNLQMFLSNLLFDAITISMTFIILRRTLFLNSLLSFPISIILLSLLAFVTSFCSLYFGVLNSNYSLNFYEVLRTFIGRSQDGSHWEFGPFFWLMHTTFIPLITFLFLLLVSWFGKIVFIFFSWFFNKGKLVKSPLELTSAFFALCSALCIGIRGILSIFDN